MEPRYYFGLEIFACLFVLASILISGSCDVLIISLTTNKTSDIFPDLPSTFGHAIPDEGILGRHVIVSPPDGCEPLNPAPVDDVGFNPGNTWIAVIRKGGCDYKTKVLNAMMANYSAAIVYNVGSNRLELMRCLGAGCSGLIPSMFIGADDGMLLQRYDSTEFLVFLTDELPFDLNKYLLPFAVVVGVCFFILLVFMIYKCIRDSRRARRHRMPSRSLKKIPLIKFKKGDPYDLCAICLDEYIDGEKLRLLNCSHAFHCKCVDPWLTKNRRVCPICKRKVFARGERHVHSDSSSDEDDDASRRSASQRSSRRETATDVREEETAPLLAQPPPNRGGGGGGGASVSLDRFLRWLGGDSPQAPPPPTMSAAPLGPTYGTVAQPAASAVPSDHSINGDERSVAV